MGLILEWDDLECGLDIVNDQVKLRGLVRLVNQVDMVK